MSSKKLLKRKIAKQPEKNITKDDIFDGICKRFATLPIDLAEELLEKLEVEMDRIRVKEYLD